MYCIDGIRRDPEIERKLNEAFAIVFRDQAGELVLDYLRGMTLNMVAGPEVSSIHLHHLEGQRFLYALIEQRIDHGKRGLPDGDRADADADTDAGSDTDAGPFRRAGIQRSSRVRAAFARRTASDGSPGPDAA